MVKIQDKDTWYEIARVFANHHLRRSFKRYRVVGRENIPDNGACIYASNHCSALIDALAMIKSTKGRKVFIARSDIFQNPKTAKILNWMKIMPIFRIRDGISSVRDKNGAIIEKAVDVIHDEVPLCLFPEATHRTKHSLRQLSKGVFHIALEAYRKFGDEKPVYIVPIGLEYGDYFRFRSTLLVSYGEPINVTEYMKAHENDNEAVIFNDLKGILKERMANLISYVPDDEDYDAIWEMTKIKSGQISGDLTKELRKKQEIIGEAVELREKAPERAKKLFEDVGEFMKLRKKYSISVRSAAAGNSIGMLLLKTLLVALGLPFFLVAAAVTSPIWIASYFILKTIEDEAFKNTYRLCVEMVLHPLIMAVGMTLLFCLVPWEIAAIGSVFLYFSYVFFIDFKEFLRIWVSDIRWMFNKRLKQMKNLLFLQN